MSSRGGPSAAATCKMYRFVTKRSILDVAAVLDPPLRWMYIVRSEARIYQEEIKTRLKFHKMRGCLQDT